MSQSEELEMIIEENENRRAKKRARAAEKQAKALEKRHSAREHFLDREYQDREEHEKVFQNRLFKFFKEIEDQLIATGAIDVNRLTSDANELVLQE